MRVTVLGGTGLLGRHLVPLLKETGHEVTVASRSTKVKADLATGEGLADAVGDADLVVHLASDARKPDKVDVAGTQNRPIGLQETLSACGTAEDRGEAKRIPTCR